MILWWSVYISWEYSSQCFTMWCEKTFLHNYKNDMRTAFLCSSDISFLQNGCPLLWVFENIFGSRLLFSISRSYFPIRKGSGGGLETISRKKCLQAISTKCWAFFLYVISRKEGEKKSDIFLWEWIIYRYSVSLFQILVVALFFPITPQLFISWCANVCHNLSCGTMAS